MSVRFCPICASEVEVADGFCLLGHSVRLEAQMDQSLSELRAEVDKAFADARVAVTTAMGPPPPPPPPPIGAVRPPAVDAQAVLLWGQKTGIATVGPKEGPSQEIGSSDVFAGPSSVAIAPGPWAPLTEPSLAGIDPIEAFAPPPRVDWGPDRLRGFKRRAAR